MLSNLQLLLSRSFSVWQPLDRIPNCRLHTRRNARRNSGRFRLGHGNRTYCQNYLLFDARTGGHNSHQVWICVISGVVETGRGHLRQRWVYTNMGTNGSKINWRSCEFELWTNCPSSKVFILRKEILRKDRSKRSHRSFHKIFDLSRNCNQRRSSFCVKRA